MAESEYLLTNAEPETGDRFSGLEQTFDEVSIANLERLDVPVGARCLEVGAGSGSIARWFAGRVGPTGRVLATDLDTRWFHHDGSPQLEVRELDLVGDPIPDGPWDVIHERLVLQHIPDRLAVLDRLVAALAPGGWILVEDFDTAEVRTTDRCSTPIDASSAAGLQIAGNPTEGIALPRRTTANFGIGSPDRSSAAFTTCFRRQSDVVQLELPL